MATTKTTTKKDSKAKAPKKVATKSLAVKGADVKNFSSDVIVRPRVTEKGAFLSTEDRMVYVFEVSKFATKHDVAKSISGLYKVVPEKVAILKVPAKRSFVRGRITKGKTGRKAYVYLKKGDKIENL